MADQPATENTPSYPSRRHIRRGPWIIVIAVAAVVWLVAGALGRDGGEKSGGKGKGKNNLPASVAVATVKKGDLDIYIDALGTAIPLNTVLVRSRVDGELMRVHFREGQDVKAGDLLAEIDPRPFAVQLAQARGKLARDEALLKNAQTDLERYQTLWSQDSISRQELDTQQALVHQYDGAVQSDRGEVQSAELQLTYAKITAPVSGRVGLRQVDAGNIVHANDSKGLLLITQVDPISVVFSVPEDRIGIIARRSAGNAELVVEAWDRERLHKLGVGRLDSVDNQIDLATGTVKLKAVFSSNSSSDANRIGAGKTGDSDPLVVPALFPNQFVNVRLRVDTVRDATLIPIDAVQRGSKGLFVYALQNDQTVKQQPIDIHETAGDRVAVSRGIEVGARLVVDGTDKLRDGAKVTVIESRFDASGASTEALSADAVGGTGAPAAVATKNPQLTQRQAP
jgi:multidrug efflux system membrane fusion protein